MRDIVAERIRAGIGDENAVFVFPSDVAASLWLEEALGLTGAGTLPKERFVAWDRFKEEAVQETVRGKAPVGSVVRKLYALDLARRNASADTPLFSSLIPKTQASGGAVFADWLSRILPQLETWERKRAKSPASREEDADLGLLKRDYAGFLDAHALFEPAWQRPPLRDTGKRYVIFYPEAIEDFGEYANLLVSSDFVETVPVPALAALPVLSAFENSRKEITAVALAIERAIRDGVPADRIALSVPDLETVAPYVMRELSLRGIPSEYRSGFPLASLPAGRLFALLMACASSRFSFASMKALLLDRLIPWKRRDLAEALVSFGIRNHCVTSWKEGDSEVDVWEAAFLEPTRFEAGDAELARHYRNLSRAIRDLSSAKTFSEVRIRYFEFKGKFLDMSRLRAEDDAVLARCVKELRALEDLEKEYAAILPASPLAFFVATLGETKYVAQRDATGVNVFPYRVAAGAPYDRHFVIDASQDKATVLYRQLMFLGRDARDALNVDDIDASPAFFSIYAASGTSFSFASRAFDGYRTPHGWFEETRDADDDRKPDDDRTLDDGRDLGDPYVAEREWFAGASDVSGANCEPRIHAAQRDGVDSWLTARGNATGSRRFSYLTEPFGESLAVLSARIAERQMRGDDVLVTQTDLSVFAACPSRWLLSRALSLDEDASDAELFNDRNLGILYHDVLQKLYATIRDDDRAFNAKKIEAYRSRAYELARSAASDHAEFRGPIAAPLIESLVKKIGDGICGILERDAVILDGFVPALLEGELAHSAGGIRYFGKIDRVSARESDGAAVLIDYKSGKPPAPSAYAADGDRAISDFQIPMYAYLAENSEDSPWRGRPLEFAWFAGIQEGDYRPIINDGELISHGKKRGMVTREEFGAAMESFKAEAERFAAAVKAKDFRRPADLPASECFACDYRKICRYTYSVGSP